MKVKMGEEIKEARMIDHPSIRHGEPYPEIFVSLPAEEVSGTLYLNSKAAKVVTLYVNLEVSPLIVGEWSGGLQSASCS